MAHPVAFAVAASGPVVATPVTSPSLTQEQLSQLSAILSALTPGSMIAGAFDRRLSGSMSRMLPAIQQGLEAMDAECLRKNGRGILDLSTAERGQFVRELRSGHKLTAFFRLVTSTFAS